MMNGNSTLNRHSLHEWFTKLRAKIINPTGTLYGENVKITYMAQNGKETPNCLISVQKKVRKICLHP